MTPYEQGYYHVLVKLAVEGEGAGIAAPIGGAVLGGGLGMAGGGIGSMVHMMKTDPRGFERGAVGLQNNKMLRDVMDRGSKLDYGKFQVLRDATNKHVPFKELLVSQQGANNRAAKVLAGGMKRWGGRGGLIGAGLGIGAGLLAMRGNDS